MNGKVCIGIPIYNGEQTLRKTLDSILANSDYIHRVILSDNCSTDGTAKICKEYCEKNDIFEYHCNETNIGSLKNSYRVAELADGDYYMQLGAHDIMSHDYIKELLDRFEDDVVGVFGEAIDQNGSIVNQYFKDYIYEMKSEDRLERLEGFLLGYEHCTAFYGLYRLKVFRDVVMYMKEVEYGGIGWDPLVVMLATFHGKLIYEPGITIGVYDREETPEEARKRYEEAGIFTSRNDARVIYDFYCRYMNYSEKSKEWLENNRDRVVEVFENKYGYFGIWKPFIDAFWRWTHRVKIMFANRIASEVKEK